MNEQDIRWIQRFNSYCKALDELKEEVELTSQRELSDLEKKGVIQSFEIVQELSWLLIKDFYESIGKPNIQGSSDAFQLAFKRGLVKNPSLMETIEKYYDAFENKKLLTPIKKK